MKITTEVTAVSGGVVKWHENNINYVPAVEVAKRLSVPSNLFENITLNSECCIYCRSKEQLTKEHMLPYALGGKATIKNGSCESCRKITHKFETNVLRGPMRYVRFLHGLPSRNRHSELAREISFWVRRDDIDEQLVVDVSAAPILLPYPLFPELNLADSANSALGMQGFVTGSYGVDHDTFVLERNIQELRFISSLQSPIAFAQSMAKIAFCFAWSRGVIQTLDETDDLIDAMLNTPENLGRFVGTAPEPFIAFPDVSHRVEMRDDTATGFRIVEVQLFAPSGAPTYLVRIGKNR